MAGSFHSPSYKYFANYPQNRDTNRGKFILSTPSRSRLLQSQINDTRSTWRLKCLRNNVNIWEISYSEGDSFSLSLVDKSRTIQLRRLRAAFTLLGACDSTASTYRLATFAENTFGQDRLSYCAKCKLYNWLLVAHRSRHNDLPTYLDRAMIPWVF